MKVSKVKENQYEVKTEPPMQVPLRIFASESILENMQKDRSIQQGMNVAAMPGIQKYSIMLSDAHQGYGFSIGGVAAFDAKKGCITPGGIGFDINCGVRLLATSLKKEQVAPSIKKLLDVLFKHVPPGVGGNKSLFRLNEEELKDVLVNGARWALSQGLGEAMDVERCEENGSLKGADPAHVSHRAKSRGRNQLGTLGSGNHFLEIQYVEKIHDEEAAKVMGLEEGQVVVMLHCGSRGLGHQVCSDYLRRMEEEYPDLLAQLPEKDLAYAPLGSKIATEYFGAMNAAANFAWANRHVIGHQTRKAFEEVFPGSQLHTVYDVCHNIAKLEEHDVDGVQKEVMVHRKGATRAFPPGHEKIPAVYRSVGQPVLIPGSMGTASYVLVGKEESMKLTFGSSAHGAGRVMSRTQANKETTGQAVKDKLEAEKIFIKAASWRGISEEAPFVYKDIDEVVKVNHDLGISTLVARLKPLGVVKG